MRRALLLLSLVLPAGCGKENANVSTPSPPPSPVSQRVIPPPAPAPCGSCEEKPPEVARENTLTQFQRRRLIGHYSTLDGTSGFILDRTQSPWRSKLDGTSKVVTMDEENQPRTGVKEYRSDDRAFWIRVDMETGVVELFVDDGHPNGVHVKRDSDAEPLR